jgi:hypothetical protein
VGISFKLIEAKTLTSTTPSVTFSTIPQTYTDLKVLLSCRSSGADGSVNSRLTFNGQTGAYYESLFYAIMNNAQAGQAERHAAFQYLTWTGGGTGANASANVFGNSEVYVFNYTSTGVKAVSSDAARGSNSSASGDNWLMLDGAFWNPNTTGPITSLTFTSEVGDYVAGSTFYLYGIANA